MDTKGGLASTSSENILKAFDPQGEDILYMDMSGGSKSSRNSWTSDNIDLYMNTPRASPRSSWAQGVLERALRKRRVNPIRLAAASRELWKSETVLTLKQVTPRGEMIAQSPGSDVTVKSVSDPELCVCDTYVSASPLSIKDSRTAGCLDLSEYEERTIVNTRKPCPAPISITNKDNAYSGSELCCHKTNLELIKCKDGAAPHCCSPQSDGASSPIYLSPHCQSCMKSFDLPPTSPRSNDSACDMDATYMSIAGISESESNTPVIVTPPELPKRNPDALLKSEKITQKMCRCREVRKHNKRSVHLEDSVEGLASRVYTVKDIVDSVDELIGAFCEDTSISDFTTESRKSHNLLRKPSLKSGDNYLFKRPKSISFRRAGDKSVSRDSGFESDDYKNKPSGNANNAGRCKLLDCSNCQEFDGSVNKEDDGGTLDCYSYAYSKRLPVETYIPLPVKCKKNTRDRSDSFTKSPLRRSKSLFEYIPNVTSGMRPKLNDVTDSNIYRSFVNKASKVKNKVPIALTRYGLKSQKVTSEPAVRKSSVQNFRKPLKDVNNNSRGNHVVERKGNSEGTPRNGNRQAVISCGLKETAC